MSNQIYSNNTELYPLRYAEVKLQGPGLGILQDTTLKADIDFVNYNNFGNVNDGGEFKYTPNEDQVVKISFSVGVEVVSNISFAAGSFEAWIQDGHGDIYSKNSIEVSTTPNNNARFSLSGSSIIRLVAGEEVTVFLRREFAADSIEQILNFITIENVESDI